MYRRLTDNDGRVVAFKLTKAVTEEDIQEMEDRVDDACKEFGKIRVLFELVDLKISNPTAYWDTFKIAKRHGEDVERVAIIGDRSWEKRWIEIGGMLVDSDVRYFDHEQLEAAWRWIRG